MDVYLIFMWVNNLASQVVLVVKSLPAKVGRPKRFRSNPWVGEIPWKRKWQPAPVFLPGKFHGQMSLVGYSYEVAESDTTEGLKTTHHNY